METRVNGIWAIKSSSDSLKSLHEPPTRSQGHNTASDFDKIFKKACEEVNNERRNEGKDTIHILTS